MHLEAMVKMGVKMADFVNVIHSTGGEFKQTFEEQEYTIAMQWIRDAWYLDIELDGIRLNGVRMRTGRLLKPYYSYFKGKLNGSDFVVTADELYTPQITDFVNGVATLLYLNKKELKDEGL